MTAAAVRRLRQRPAPRKDPDAELVWYRAFQALARHGHIPGTDLGVGTAAFGLTLHVLSKGPGYIGCNETVARALRVSKRTVISASGLLSRLELGGGVVLMKPRASNIVVPLHGYCPWDEHGGVDWARSNKHGWEIAAATLLDAIERERQLEKVARAEQREAKRAARALRRLGTDRDAATAPIDHSHGCKNQHGPLISDLRGSSDPSPPTPAPVAETPHEVEARAGVPPANVAGETPRESHDTDRSRPGGASGTTESAEGARARGAPRDAPARSADAQTAVVPGCYDGAIIDGAPLEPEVQRLAEAWNALGMRNVNGRHSVAGVPELRTLRRRLREGFSVDDLEAAILGAGVDDWLRKGRARNAFAVVFAPWTGGLSRKIHEGHKLQDQDPPDLLGGADHDGDEP